MDVAAGPTLPHDTVVDLLDGVEVLAPLSGEEIDALARKVDTVSWPAGTMVFQEGDRGDTCYVIESGRVKLTRRLVDGQPIALAHIGHGGIVGELALFAAGRRSASMEAVEPTAAVAIAGDDLMSILRGNAEAAIGMTVHVAQLLQKAENRLFSTATSTVNGRILATLLAQVEVRQARHPGDDDVELVGSAADLARLAGAPKDATTRVLHWLENEGTITLKRGRIIVHSTAALRGHLG
jgi:CRP/FNR family transcriptional regulator, cyclic AMP receptor protein